MGRQATPAQGACRLGAGNSRRHGKRCLARRRLGAGQTRHRGCPPPRALLRALWLRATDIATPERVAQVLNAEMQALKLGTARVMLNQVDALSDPAMADRFEATLGRPVIATSLK